MPDAYGPFWLCTTLAVLIAVVGNLISKISHVRSKSSDKWAYDFTEGTVALIVVYAYFGLVTFCVWGAMKWKEVPASLLDVACLYGYSMFPFLVAVLLCALPWSWWQWLVCVLMGGLSLLYLLLNFWQLWKLSLERAWFIGIVVFVVVFHLGFTLTMKLVFFNFAL